MLVCAMDIIEHVDDEDGVLTELARVCQIRRGRACWRRHCIQPAGHAFDDFVGHYRRYEPEQLLTKIRAHGFTLEKKRDLRHATEILVAAGSGA